MGGLNRGSMTDDLKAKDSYGQYHYYSYMLTLKDDIYYAAKTAIARTKGLEADVSWPLEKKNGSYVWLFQNEEGRKTLAYINREGGHPEAADLVKAFDSEDGVWTFEGTLPDGLSFNKNTGTISGTPCHMSGIIHSCRT